MKMAAGCAKNLANRRILPRHLSVTSPVQLMEIAYAIYGDDSPALNDSASRTGRSRCARRTPSTTTRNDPGTTSRPDSARTPPSQHVS